jgi:hypothetical protein
VRFVVHLGATGRLPCVPHISRNSPLVTEHYNAQKTCTGGKNCFQPENKKKNCPTTRHEGAWWERRYSLYSFSTSALDGGEWSESHTGHALPREKDSRYPLYRRLGETQSRTGHREYRKNLFASAGYRTWNARSSSPQTDTVLTELRRSEFRTIKFVCYQSNWMIECQAMGQGMRTPMKYKIS